MILTIELLDGESLPQDFARYIAGAGPSFERRNNQTVPPIILRLVRGGKTFQLEGGFWIETEAIS